MNPFADLSCGQCGVRDIAHFQNPHGEWRNRCQSCGHETEYLPTQAEIAAACEAIRAARPWQTDNDDDERAMRLVHPVWETDDEFDETDVDAFPLAPDRRLAG